MKIKELKVKLLILGAVCAVLGLCFLFKPQCLFLTATGIECPACGLSRAWFSVFRGDITSAFGYNAMFWSIPLLVILYLTDGKLTGKKLIDNTIFILILIGFVLNFLIKI